MNKTNIKRVIRSGFLNFSRSGIISAASVLVVTVTLSVITFLILLNATLRFTLDQIEEKVDITVYYTLSAQESEILALNDVISSLPEVDSVEYVSRETALEEFRQRHKDDYLTLQALDELGENPLSASLNIRAKETSQYEGIANFLKSDDVLASDGSQIIDKVNYFQNKLVIDRLSNIISSARNIGVLITILLSVVSVMITFTTISLTIYFSKEEIGVMRLVGAENMYIRGPFITEGAIYGVISSVITMILFIPITIWLGRTMTYFLGINMWDYYRGHFVGIFILILIIGVALGTAASLFAIRKYLKK
ncbi:FtsX-like permease family protein [Candidatus Nomurabacteria bacterium]|nr:permease-like cell division protein FtsX [Candidatus Nomurabacteria bacterium]MCB9820692.1 FtsX-like permease family protein [Candidatus Nomurabacteria bacterium]